MKKLLNLGKALSQGEQKKISGGAPPGSACYRGTDRMCCGNAAWQCGIGPSSGGFFNGNFCDCV